MKRLNRNEISSLLLELTWKWALSEWVLCWVLCLNPRVQKGQPGESHSTYQNPYVTTRVLWVNGAKFFSLSLFLEFEEDFTEYSWYFKLCRCLKYSFHCFKTPKPNFKRLLSSVLHRYFHLAFPPNVPIKNVLLEVNSFPVCIIILNWFIYQFKRIAMLYCDKNYLSDIHGCVHGKACKMIVATYSFVHTMIYFILPLYIYVQSG